MLPFMDDDGAQLWSGDALAVLRHLDTASVDALITDPPYSSGGFTRGDRVGQSPTAKYVTSGSSSSVDLATFAGDNRDQRSYGYWCALWLSECLRVVKPGGFALLFTDWRQLPTTSDALQAGGFIWRGLVPWVKPSYRPQAGRFAAQCEYVVWGSAGSLEVDYTDECFPGFYAAASPREREHITQKPVDVMRELVRIVPRGGTVLDPFMGAGTTGVAAMIEGRRFIGAESTETFQQISRRRIREAQGQRVDHGEQQSLDIGDATP